MLASSKDQQAEGEASPKPHVRSTESRRGAEIMAPLGLGRSVMVGWHTPCVSTPTGISPVLVTTQIDELTDPTLPSPPPTMESQDTLRVARTVDPWPAEVRSGPYDSLGRCAIASALEEKQSGFGSIDPVVPPGTRWCKAMLAQLPWARCAESECAMGETIDRHDQPGRARAKRAAVFAVRARYERSFMLTSGPTNVFGPTTGTSNNDPEV